MTLALLVGGPPEVASLLAGAFTGHALQLELAGDADAAIARVRAPGEPVAVLLVPPGAAQVDVTHHLRRELPSTHVVLLHPPPAAEAARNLVRFDPLVGREVTVLPLAAATLGQALEEVAARTLKRQSLGPRLERMNAELAQQAPPVERAELEAPRLAAILEQSVDGIFFLELSGRIVAWNAAASRQFGWNGERPADLAALGTAWAPGAFEERAGAGAWSVELERDGRALEVSFAPVRDARAALVGVSAIARDVTDRRDALLEARRQAEFEQLFVGIVSHDLRNPLAAIAMQARLLLRSLDEKGKHGAARILSATDRATRLIHDLLDVTHARLKGTLPINRRPADLHAVTRQVVDELRLAHAGRMLAVEHTGEARGEWDVDRLAQVVTNLVVNALTYGWPASAVTVRVRGGVHEAVLAVHNLGPPIAPEQLATLFEPLRRGLSGDSTSRSIGLGLYITEQIVRAHGGEIAVTSDASGTTFTIRLPNSATAPP